MNNYIARKSLAQAFFQDKSQFSVLVVNFLLKLNSKYDKIFPSQANIAMWIGCSRKTVNLILKELDEQGWVKKIQRKTRQTCIYVISTKFNLLADFPEARKKLPGLVNYWYKLTLGYFMNGPGKKLVEPKVTPYKEENSTYKYTSVSVSKMNSLLGDLKNRFINKSLKKEEERMESSPTFNVSPLLRDITNRIGLTKWGQIRLTIYSDQALEETLRNYKPCILPEDNFVWFETYCHGVSIRNNLPIHLELYDTMKKRYNMPSNAKWVREQKSYQKDDTLSSDSATIVPLKKHKEVHPMFAQFTFPGDNV